MTDLDLRCDHFMRATPDIETANEQMTRLGLRASPPAPAADTGARYTVVTLGSFAAGNTMYVEYMTHDDRERAAGDPRMSDMFPLLDAGGGMKALTFVAEDLEAVKKALGHLPNPLTETVTHLHGGGTVTTVNAGYVEVAGCPMGFIAYPQAFRDAAAANPPVKHDFPLERVDHMAVVPPDLDAATTFWCDVMGLKHIDDIEDRGFVIRRLQVGDMIIELVKSTNPDGPGLTPGLMPVMACEVSDVAGAVELARSRGFHPPDPAKGIVPGTLVSTIPPDETSGISWQLLQYA